MKIFGIEISSNKDNYSVKIDKKDMVQTAIKSYIAYQILKPAPKSEPIVISSINQIASEIDYDALVDAVTSYKPPKIELFGWFTPKELKWVSHMHYMDREGMEKIKEKKTEKNIDKKLSKKVRGN